MLASWQTWLAALLCLAAAAYVARRAWLACAGKQTNGCGTGCGSCESKQEKRGPLLMIQPVGERRD